MISRNRRAALTLKNLLPGAAGLFPHDHQCCQTVDQKKRGSNDVIRPIQHRTYSTGYKIDQNHDENVDDSFRRSTWGF